MKTSSETTGSGSCSILPLRPLCIAVNRLRSTDMGVWEIMMGYSVMASDWKVSICFWKPEDRLRMTAIPMMPMLEANAVRKALPFLLLMLL